MQTLAVIGAAGSVGRKVCRAALDRDCSVVAIDRAFDDAQDCAGLVHRTANVLEDDLRAVLAGCDAVVSTLGLPFSLRNAQDPPPLYSKGTASIIAAMRAQGIARLTVISAAFAVPQNELPLWFTMSVVPALHSILEEMRAMERMIVATDLDWTIARPGWLLDEPANGSLVEGDGLLPPGAFRCREGDLAAFLVDTAVTGRWSRQKPAVGAPDSAFNESPLALGKVLAGMIAPRCRSAS